MRRVGAIVLAAALMAGALWIWPGLLTGPDPSPGTEAGWRTAIVERRDIGSTVLATGVIRPMVGAEVQVGSRVSGNPPALNVSIGDQVEANEVLAKLDPTEFQARLDQALATLETAEVEERFAGIELDRARELQPRRSFLRLSWTGWSGATRWLRPI